MKIITMFLAVTAGMISVLIAAPSEDARENRKAGAGQIFYHYVGRVTLNFVTGKGTVFGYITQLSGVSPATSLFKGTPGESPAFFTFRADVSFQPLPGNGDLGGGFFA